MALTVETRAHPEVAVARRKTTVLPRRHVVREAAAATLPAWIAARVAVAAGIIATTVATDQLGARHPAPLVDKLLAWDAHQYVAIAAHGYRAVPAGFRFFPLFPLLVRLVAVPLAGHEGAAAVVVANAATFGLGMALYRLVLLETESTRTARLSIWLLLASPAAAPLVMGYAESLGLLAAVLAFLFARQRRWSEAAVAGAVVGATWSIGAVLCLPMAVEAARGWRHAAVGDRLRRALMVATPLAATAAYLAYVQWETRDALHDVFGVQVDVYRRGFEDPVVRLYQAGYDLVAGHHPEGIAFPWAIVAIVLLVVVVRRLPASFALWSAAVLLLDMSAHNLDSFERYALRAFPLAVGAALVIRKERTAWLALSIGLAGLTVYASAIVVGAKVP